MSMPAFRVLLKSPFLASTPAIYGHDGYELLRALHNWGADVYPQPVWVDVPVPGDLLPLFGRTLEGPFDLTICHWDPPHLEITRQAREVTRLAVAWTMWEMCVDPETEIFTRRGWLSWDQVTEDDQTLGINPETGLAEWQQVERISSFYGAREMLAREYQVHSSLTTLNHRWLVKDGRGKWKWRTSDTLRRHDQVPRSAVLADLPQQPKYSDAFVELVAWTYAEGWLERGRSIRIGQSNRANPEATQRIRAALHALLGPSSGGQLAQWPKYETWTESREKREGAIFFNISRPASQEILACCPGKVPSHDFLLSLTRAQLELFIDVSCQADGWNMQRGGPGFGQNLGPRLEAFIYACILAGKSVSPVVVREENKANWSPHGRVQVGCRRFTAPELAARMNPGSARVVDYDGVVWCPTVRLGNWLARRRGTMYYTGNSSLYPHCEAVDPITEEDLSEWKEAWHLGWQAKGKPAPPFMVKEAKDGIRGHLQWFDAVLGYSGVTMQAMEPHIPGHVHRGVLQGGFEASEWKYLERDWSDGGVFRFGVHGALNRRKEPFLVLQAFVELCEEHPEFKEKARLLFHTTVPGVFPEMNEIYARAGIGVRVFMGAWDKPTLEEFYRSCHALVYPSHGEGKNLPCLEFQATGGVVLATDWSGHALALDTPLPTPVGWTTMGDVGVGSVILDDQSRPCVVTAKSGIQYRDCFRVKFSDGTSVVASDEHRWLVQESGRPWLVKTTRDLHDLCQRGRQALRLPPLARLDGTDRELAVPPYVLGLWLADGTSREGRITVGSMDVAEQVKNLQQYGEVSSETYVKTGKGEGWRIAMRWLAHELAEIGLHGPAGAKFIPSEYLRASVSQRLELLQGLMDGDGCVTARGQCCFDNSNSRLVADVAELLRSLGIRVTGGLVPKKDQHRAYRISFWTTEPVFRLERKRKRQEEFGASHKRAQTRTIRSVELVPTVPTQCLTVDSPSHLYLCGAGWTPTHNTNWLSEDTGYPLACTVQPMFPGQPELAHWAVVELAEVKRAMWHVFTHRDEARAKGELASRVIPQMCSWDVVVENLFRRLRDLVPGPGEVVYNLAMACRRDQPPEGILPGGMFRG